jgi:hypothetical protein
VARICNPGFSFVGGVGKSKELNLDVRNIFPGSVIC